MGYIDPEIVARAREVDLLTYLRQRDPDQLVRIGVGAYCTKDHDSLKISNGKWYWWSRGIGGRSALDYLIAVKGMGFVEAVQEVSGGWAAAMRASPGTGAPKPKRAPERRTFRPPPESGTDAALAYLQQRGIDSEIAATLAYEGLIYGSKRYSHQNVVFVGKGTDGMPRYAAIRSCSGDFKGEVTGSDKSFGFVVEQRSGPIEAHVFESAIDALSFATLRKMAGRDWRELSLISLGGIPPARGDGQATVPAALSRWMGEHPLCAEVHLHLDNDGPGRAAARAIAERFAPRVPVGIEPPPTGKDVNNHLLAVLGRTVPHSKALERGRCPEGR